MRKTSIPNKLNHKLQAHARVCEEINEENKKNHCWLKYFVVEGSTLKTLNSDTTDSYETYYKDRSKHKGISTVSIKL